MPGVKISSLQTAALAPGDIIPAARSGITVGIPGSQILNRFTQIETRIDALSGRHIRPRNSSTINTSFNTSTYELSSDLGPYLDLSGRTVVLPPVIAIPPGAVMPFVGQNAPVGWLICDGSYVPNGNGTVTQNGVSRSYNFGPLYTALGTTYGPEIDGKRKLPDLRGYFVRGFGANEDTTTSGLFGQKQEDTFQGHKHGLHDPTHGHTGSTSTDGKHKHTFSYHGGSEDPNNDGSGNPQPDGRYEFYLNGETNEVGDHSHTVSIVASSTDVKVLHPTADTATPGMTPADTNGPGGTPRTSNETRPRNIAMLYCVKY